MNYAYIRVSSYDQNENRQIDALEGYEIDKVYIEKASGKDFDRPQYRKLVRRIKKNDLLVIKSIDRLGRNFEEILEQWRILTKEIGIQICVIDMPLLDTRNKNDLISSLIANVVLQLLSFVAQTERDSIKKRQQEGIAAARARGQKFGRPRIETPDNFCELEEQWKQKNITMNEMLNRLGISRTTYYRIRNQNRI